MKTIERDHVRIDYVEEGTGDTTLLFVHGSFINKDYWDEQLKYFSKNYHVIAIDLPAHGKSGSNREEWRIEDFGKDVVEVIKDLELRNVILIGHSLGADAILEAAVAYTSPVIGVVAVDYFKNAGTEMPAEMQQQVDNVLAGLRTDFSATTEAYARQGLLTAETDSVITKRVVGDYRNANPDMGIPSIESLFNYAPRERELLQKLPFKLYLIQVDYLPTNEVLLRQYVKSGYELTILHGSSHFPMIEIPQELNTALELVIRKISSQK